MYTRRSSRVLVSSEREMERLAEDFARTLKKGDCVLLFGEMGVGKSVFARSALRYLGVRGAMPSPTFTILNTYDCERVSVAHMDLYRIVNVDEAISAGVADALSSCSICFVEWPDDFAELFDGVRVLKVHIEFAGDDAEKRYVIIEGMIKGMIKGGANDKDSRD